MMDNDENDAPCYICQPDDPDAAEEGCAACERDFWIAVGVITPGRTEA